MKELGPKAQKLREQREADWHAHHKPNPFQDAARGRDPAPKKTARLDGDMRRDAVTGDGQTIEAVGFAPATAINSDSEASQPRGEPIHTKPTQPIGSPNLKRGRPKKGEKRAKPWEAAGMSKASWYRQKKDKK